MSDDIEKTKYKKEITCTKIPWSTEGKNEGQSYISLPSGTNEEYAKATNKLSDKDKGRPGKDLEAWAKVLDSSGNVLLLRDPYKGLMSSEETNYQQGVTIDGKELRNTQPKSKPLKNSELLGETAVFQVMEHLGAGARKQTMLPHTGIWLTIKPGSEGEAIELYRGLVKDKITVGRATNGLVFSNLSYATVERASRFVINNVVHSSLEYETPKLLDIITLPDLFILLNGYLSSKYPSGHNYERPCIDNPNKCTHIHREKINFDVLQHTDNNALTVSQKRHLLNRAPGTMTLETVKEYQSQFTDRPSSTFKYSVDDNDITINLRIPTITDHIKIGETWVNSIIDLVDETIGSSEDEVDESARSSAITLHAQATVLNIYSHWVKSIELGSNIITDRNTIHDTLTHLSSITGAADKITDNIFLFIKEVTVSIVGIDAFICPKCGDQQEPNNPPNGFEEVIPLDILSLFFILNEGVIQRIIQQ